MHIELKDRNRLKEFFQNFHNKVEDILFPSFQDYPNIYFLIINSIRIRPINQGTKKHLQIIKSVGAFGSIV